MPSRRHSAFASPSPELAIQSSLSDTPRAFRVVIESGEPAAQIPKSDARHVPEARRLPRPLFLLLGGQEFLDGPLDRKSAIAPLLCPCLARNELEELFQSAPLTKQREPRWSEIRFWDRVRLFPVSEEPPFPHGEIFFSTLGWRLEPL